MLKDIEIISTTVLRRIGLIIVTGMLLAGYGMNMTGTATLIAKAADTSHAHHKTCSCDLKTGDCDCNNVNCRHNQKPADSRTIPLTYQTCSSSNTAAVPSYQIPKFLTEGAPPFIRKTDFTFLHPQYLSMEDQVLEESLFRPPIAA